MFGGMEHVRVIPAIQADRYTQVPNANICGGQDEFMLRWRCIDNLLYVARVGTEG